MTDDLIDHGEIGEESADLHLVTALETGQGIDFINLADHPGPAAAGDSRAILERARKAKQEELAAAKKAARRPK